MRVTIFHNPSAGHDRSTGDDIVRAIERAGHEAVYCSTDRRNLDERLRAPGDLVVAAGGDGTVRKVASRLAGRDVPMTVLPLGTANNVARSLGIIGNPQQLIAGWGSWRRRSIDVGRVQAPWGDRRFIEGTGFGPSVGAMATLSHVPAEPSVDGTPEAELHRDLRVVREIIADYPVYDCRVVLDGHDLSGAYLLVEAMNIRSIGPNLELAPQADVDDGQLDLVLLTDNDRARLRDYVTDRLEGRPARLDVPPRRGRRIEVTWPGSRVHVDDVILPTEEDAASGRWWSEGRSVTLTVTVEPRTLELLVPGD